MKNNKKNWVVYTLFAGFISYLFVTSYAMEVIQKYRRKPLRIQLQPEQPRLYKTEIVWIKTSDNQLMEIPQWQIDQMKAVQQVGKNSKNNPADASMVSSKQLALIQKTLQKTSNLEQFRYFYASLSDDERKSLLAYAFTLGMQGLASLLITYMFPLEVQQQMGASLLQPAGIISPVVAYLEKQERKDRTINLWPHFEDSQRIADVEDIWCIAFNPYNDEQVIIQTKGIGIKSWMPMVTYFVGGGSVVTENIILWNVKTNEKIELSDSGKITCIAFSPDGAYITAGTNEQFCPTQQDKECNNLVLYDSKTGQKIRTFQKSAEFISCLNFSSDSNYIVAGSNKEISQNNPVVYDVKTGKPVYAFPYNLPVNCVAFNPQNNDIVVGFKGPNNLMLFDGKTYSLKKSFKGLNNISRITFSPDGKCLVGASGNTLMLWNTETGDPIKKLTDEFSYIGCLAFSPNSEYMITGLKTLTLWDGKTGAFLRNFDAGRSPYERFCSFSSDGRYILYNEGKAYDSNLIFSTFIDLKAHHYIANNLNIAQARFLYLLYQAKIENKPVILDDKDINYQLYITLPKNVQQLIQEFFPFKVIGSNLFERKIQERMNEYKSSLFYEPGRFFGKTEKTHDEKIKSVKNEMQKLDKNSAAYEACKRLLHELELETAFEV
jgi:hypothetical protein